MEFLAAVFFFVFGTIVGSFLNVVILRYGTGLSIFSGRSKCFACGKKLSWYELVPVWSFLFLRGKCSSCKSRISWQYPAVEFFTGIIFLAVFFSSVFDFLYTLGATRYTVLETIFSLSIFSLLIVIAGYDIKHKIIPDGLVYSFAFISLVRVFTLFPLPVLFSFPYGFYTLGAGPILALPFFLLWFFSGGRWIGLGDAKLVLGMGWFLGLFSGLSAVVLAFWIGACFSLLLMLINKFPKLIPGNSAGLFFGLKNLTMKSEVPFAPFLILATILIFFLQIDVLGLTSLLRI